MSKPSITARAQTAGFLSLLFVLIYGGCNWLAAQQETLPTWYYSWERFIPVVPWTIVPYMSIDLFFVGAPFLCKANIELRTLARRITFGILVAGIFFAAMPLTLAVPRPVPEDWTRPVFQFLHGFDRPSNLFPSLHITLRTILAVHYLRHSEGWLRGVMAVWFTLIGFSTVLTYQHHMIDVAGGFVLAILCIHLFPETAPEPGRMVPNWKAGTVYGAGAAILLVVSLAWEKGLILGWPALALALVSAAYFQSGAKVYRKIDGELPWATKLVMAPCLLGQFLSWRYYRTRFAAWSRVTPNVWLGAQLSEWEAQEAQQQGVTAVLDMTAEFTETRVFRQLNYRNLPVLDLTAPWGSELREAVAFIREQAKTGKVYVHCKAGYSRSVAVVAAYLISAGLARSVDESLGIVRQARPQVVIRPEIWKALRDFVRERDGLRVEEPNQASEWRESGMVVRSERSLSLS